MKEIKPICVLDFYVNENVQRGGHGRALFDVMLQTYRTTPERLAYDRPSNKLLGFNAKHWGLKRYVSQNNNYVIYDAYFDSAPSYPGLPPTSKPSAYDRFKQNNL